MNGTQNEDSMLSEVLSALRRIWSALRERVALASGRLEGRAHVVGELWVFLEQAPLDLGQDALLVLGQGHDEAPSGTWPLVTNASVLGAWGAQQQPTAPWATRFAGVAVGSGC